MTDEAPIGCPCPDEDPEQANHDEMAIREAEAYDKRRAARSGVLHSMFGLTPKPSPDSAG